ncbi:ferredoxin [Streptomyces sp. NPDC006012]|uniref:ferredoxin n=1 Tax=Streptomyces sp. NPDC006012 TaxID=3364739 RepID=UPI0036CCEADA
MTQRTSEQELYRFLEDRFACAQACTECARACALRVSLLDPDGSDGPERARRQGILCAEVCDTTCRMLSEQDCQDESGVRVQLEWCRAVCADSALAFGGRPGAQSTAEACRVCARACADFVALLD